jgi:hypothetical protein
MPVLTNAAHSKCGLPKTDPRRQPGNIPVLAPCSQEFAKFLYGADYIQPNPRAIVLSSVAARAP